MLRIVILLGVSALLALAGGSVLKTGQVKSYNEAGNVVAYGSIKDDGYYQAGVARSYDNSRWGIVKDNATGLEWQDDVALVDKLWVTLPNFNAHNYDDTSGDTAATYCSNLTIYDGGWRLPMIGELLTLVDHSQYHPAVTQGVFNHFNSYWIWSSTTDFYDPSKARIVKFEDGYSASHTKNTSGMILSTYVRCVRSSVTIIYPIIRIDDIVIDSGTGLQWQDNWHAAFNTKSWTDAIDYCESTLTLGGYTDWRLPNRNELLAIVDYSNMYPSIKIPPFHNIASDYYWSSTTFDSTPSKAWVVDFRNAYSPALDKQYGHFVRCVRDVQVNKPINPSIIMYLLD